MGALESNATALVAISASRVFSYAQSNYSTFFAGNPTADQITYLGRHYDYRYYPATSNYLAVDTMGGIWILGPISNNAFTSVGAVESFRNAITAWEATQPH